MFWRSKPGGQKKNENRRKGRIFVRAATQKGRKRKSATGECEQRALSRRVRRTGGGRCLGRQGEGVADRDYHEAVYHRSPRFSGIVETGEESSRGEKRGEILSVNVICWSVSTRSRVRKDHFGKKEKAVPLDRTQGEKGGETRG